MPTLSSFSHLLSAVILAGAAPLAYTLTVASLVYHIIDAANYNLKLVLAAAAVFVFMETNALYAAATYVRRRIDRRPEAVNSIESQAALLIGEGGNTAATEDEAKDTSVMLSDLIPDVDSRPHRWLLFFKEHVFCSLVGLYIMKCASELSIGFFREGILIQTGEMLLISIVMGPALVCIIFLTQLLNMVSPRLRLLDKLAACSGTFFAVGVRALTAVHGIPVKTDAGTLSLYAHILLLGFMASNQQVALPIISHFKSVSSKLSTFSATVGTIGGLCLAIGAAEFLKPLLGLNLAPSLYPSAGKIITGINGQLTIYLVHAVGGLFIFNLVLCAFYMTRSVFSVLENALRENRNHFAVCYGIMLFTLGTASLWAMHFLQFLGKPIIPATIAFVTLMVGWEVPFKLYLKNEAVNSAEGNSWFRLLTYLSAILYLSICSIPSVFFLLTAPGHGGVDKYAIIRAS